MTNRRLILPAVFLLCAAASASGRTWTDSSGRYKLDAELVSSNETHAVLKRADHELVTIPIDKLSDQDREYLQSQEASEHTRNAFSRLQSWTMRDGTKLEGRIVDYASRDISIQRRRGRIYVNDRPLENLPEFYQHLLPQIVAQKNNLADADRHAFEVWLGRQPGNAITLNVNGVVLETTNGDEYIVPFGMFSDEDQQLLQGGWQEWLAAQRKNDWAARYQQAFLLQSLAAERQQDAQVKRQIARMRLQLEAAQAGLTSLWEVTLYPAGRGGRPLWVVVPGRNSRQASQTALEQNPAYVAGPVRRVAG